MGVSVEEKGGEKGKVMKNLFLMLVNGLIFL